MKSLTAPLVLLAVLAGAGAASAQAAVDGVWPGATLLLADGWRYRDVAVYLDEMGAGLWVRRPDGAEQLVSIDRVDQIIGPGGDDITDQVLAGKRGPGCAGGQAADGGRLLKLAFTLEGGYGWPRGDWLGGNDPSWSAGARLRIGTVKRSYLGLGARYQHCEPSIWAGGDEERHAMIYDATFGWVSRPSVGGTMSYIELGGALMRTEVTYSNLADMPDHTHAESTGAFLLRVGLMVPLGGAVSLDLSGSAVFRGLLFKPEHEDEALLPGLHLGLTWRN